MICPMLFNIIMTWMDIRPIIQCSQCFLFAVRAHSAPVETDRTVIGEDAPQAQWRSPLGTFYNHLTVQSVVDNVKSLFNENFSAWSKEHNHLKMSPTALFPYAFLIWIGLHCVQTKIYTNRWAVKITGGSDAADLIAEKYGFVNMGKYTGIKFCLLNLVRSNKSWTASLFTI